ncbi:tetratricopeptide repeat protein [Flavobacterium sp. SUN052]|uniref:tetratricopeptide repeat protein n=1 Tax=Flavobacterium sp. SUN052 TaxID=3002441 RepID=UPI00237D37F1|nr:tetratricopeptide repeat protein [Flavobacterium sp. SUN052]MEC4004293.1 tetratricopeptide repeat protein [Flavobacterium sp. SUN052]
MKKIITLLILLISFAIKAQEKDKYLPQGNESFATKNYSDAEVNYRISQSKFKKKSISSYNLGTSIYKQNQPLEAKYQFEKAVKDAKTKSEKHQAFHNLGNTLMKEKEYSNAVEAYKNALRNNPSDEETRYNYALAKKMLKENPPPKNDDKGKDNKKDNKKDDKKDDKKDQNKDKDKDKKDDKKKDGNDKKDNQDKGNQPPPQPQPTGASKQRIQNLLDAVNNEEKKVQEKVKGKKVEGNPQKPEKDW